jgi:hypothetical protein
MVNESWLYGYQNNVTVNVKKTFSLDEIDTVLDYQMDVYPRGKIVLTLQKMLL